MENPVLNSRLRRIAASLLAIATVLTVAACTPNSPDLPRPTSTQPMDSRLQPQDWTLGEGEEMVVSKEGSAEEAFNVSLEEITEDRYITYTLCFSGIDAEISTIDVLDMDTESASFICDGIMNRQMVIFDRSDSEPNSLRVSFQGDGKWGFVLARMVS
ncbi:hypothetical protein [Lysinibacter cavernae]|uniref:Lipoprotein n=1 Tax=Lysinibacter cavernae TaxID=1640652 RepID=A0A7X5QZI6_9MICO|nr:hypothetical protein [Lysinibacter cavernae]NIH52811.1 hypothetical protein [Lysinibacter cavernae]